MDTHFRQNLVSHEEDISSQHYCLRWNNYQTNMTSVFHQLLKNEAFVDVTLVCKELSLKAHKVVLSACSSFFQKLLMDNPCNHPTIIMPQDICYNDLKFIIEFVYKGEIDVSQEELQSLLKTADQLKIKGLCDLPGENENDRNTPNNSYYALNDESPVVPTGLRKSYSKICRLSGSSTKRSHRNITDIPAKRYFKETATSRDIYSTEKSDRVIKTEKTNYNSLESPAENEDINMPVVLLESKDKSQGVSEEREVWSPSGTSDNHPVNMTGHGLIPAQNLFPGHVELPPEPPAPAATPVPCSPQELMQSSHLSHCSPTTHHDLSESNMSTGSCAGGMGSENDIKIKFETLRSVESMDACSRASSHASGLDNGEEHPISSHSMHMMITPELLGLIPSGSDLADDPLGSNGIKSSNGHSSSDGISRSHMNNGVMGNLSNSGGTGHGGGPKTWSQEDMELALDALRNHNMSLTKASATYGIPSTTLWQRAHRLGIDTPKKEGPTKSWTEESLNSALEALRTGTISANKASKAYGIPSSTLYKIARREGIRLAAPFNAAPTTWSPEDLERALESIRTGQTSVQKASAEFGIPTGTLYGRCKREGIELSRSNPTPWSEDAMGEALEAVRVGQMSINQAAIHYNLPYSSLYGRFKRGKYDTDTSSGNIDTHSSNDQNSSSAIQEHSMSQYPNTSSSSQNHTHVHSMSSSQSHMSGSHLNMTNNQYQHQNIS